MQRTQKQPTLPIGISAVHILDSGERNSLERYTVILEDGTVYTCRDNYNFSTADEIELGNLIEIWYGKGSKTAATYYSTTRECFLQDAVDELRYDFILEITTEEPQTKFLSLESEVPKDIYEWLTLLLK